MVINGNLPSQSTLELSLSVWNRLPSLEKDSSMSPKGNVALWSHFPCIRILLWIRKIFGFGHRVWTFNYPEKKNLISRKLGTTSLANNLLVRKVKNRRVKGMRCRINRVYLEKHKGGSFTLLGCKWHFAVRYFQFDSISFVVWTMICHCKTAQPRSRAAEYPLLEK